jgi:clan AA aspartic protease
MTGAVRGRRPLLPVTFRFPERPESSVEFVVDTGFTHFLALPPTEVAALGLPFLHRGPAVLADGTSRDVAVHAATIVWNGVERSVPVLALGRRPLLGTALLDGHELVAQFTEGGPVTVQDL